MDLDSIMQILGYLGAGGGVVGVLQWIYNRKTNKRLAEAQAKLAEAQAEKENATVNAEEWHMWREQCEAMQTLNNQLMERNGDLIRMNAEKESRFVEQTQRLRETQARELAANQKVIELTQENGELKLRLSDHECVLLDCWKRQPENEHSRRALALRKHNLTTDHNESDK